MGKSIGTNIASVYGESLGDWLKCMGLIFKLPKCSIIDSCDSCTYCEYTETIHFYILNE